VRAGDSQDEIEQHPTIQGKVIDGFRLDHLAQAHILSFEEVGGGRNLDSFTLFSQAENKIQAHVLPDLQRHRAGKGRKTGGLHVYRIVAGEQTHHFKQPVVLGGELANRTGGFGADRDASAGNRRVRWIFDSSADGREIALAQDG